HSNPDVLHHLTLGVPDLARAEASWSWLLGRLGYEREASAEHVVLLRHPAGIAVVLEQSSDMVPGMLYSRMRPGLNHMAFRVEPVQLLADIAVAAADNGWTIFRGGRHPIAGGAEVLYLEDRDGF